MGITLTKPPELDITVHESVDIGDFLRFTALVVSQGFIPWLFYLALIKIVDFHKTKFVVIKKGQEVIGGFMVTSFRMVKYKPHNILKMELWREIDKLSDRGFR